MWKRRYRKRSPGSFSRIIKVSLFSFVLLILILIFFSVRLGFFTIKQVEVEIRELKCAKENQLKDASGLIGQNFFSINAAKVAELLKNKFLCINSVVVSRRFPDLVRLQIYSRQPAAVFISLKERVASASSLIENIATSSVGKVQNTYVVDNESVVFSEDANGLNLPKVFLYNLRISLGRKLPGTASNSLQILDKLRTLGISVGDSWIDGDFLVVIVGNTKPRIIFDLNNPIDIQLASLQLILAEAKMDLKDLEFIDLRFDKPVIKVAPKK